MDYRQLFIRKNNSLKEAMRQMGETAKKILFIVEEDRLIASLTDGDIRRYLLAGGQLDDAVDAAGNHKPIIAHSRESARNLLKAKQCIAVPVINTDGLIKDVILESEENLLPTVQLQIPVAIMAGGKGTRLEPYTKILPKPLIPVGDLPIIEHIMNQFQKYGCNDFHVIVNYKKQLIKAYFAENERRYNVHWYDEDEPLGTGGGLSLLCEKVNSTFFLTNCDVILLSDYDDILRFHRDHGNVVTMVCAYKNTTIPYGVIEIGKNGEIISMKEKPELSHLTNTGIYVVEPDVLADIEKNVEMSFPDIIEKQRKKGRRVAAYPVCEHDWLDMGQLTEFENMRRRLYGE